MVISDGFQVPIYSMLSEIGTINHVEYWMNEFKRYFDDSPKQFTSDMSLVLLNAEAIAFGGCSNIYEYIDKLIEMHDENYDGTPPACFIRIDKAHLIKNVASCDPLKSIHHLVKQFYVYCTVLLMECTTLYEAENIISSILIVAYSETDGRSFFHFFLNIFLYYLK